MPERSGLPSGVRGVGAVRFTLPSRVFGTPGFGFRGHCAESDDEKAATMAADNTTVSNHFMSASRFHGPPSPGCESEGWNRGLLSRSVGARKQLPTGARQRDRLGVRVVRPVLGSGAFD